MKLGFDIDQALRNKRRSGLDILSLPIPENTKRILLRPEMS